MTGQFATGAVRPPHAFLAYWGKARAVEAGACRFHPAAYHMLDVAAVCERLVGVMPGVARALAEASGTGFAEAATFLVRLAALHDVGKFSIGFQAKVPALYPAELGGYPKEQPGGEAASHTIVGAIMLERLFDEIWSAMAPKVESWTRDMLIPATAGHHGRPVAATELPDVTIGRAAIAAARAYALEAVAAFGPESFAGNLEETPARILSWRIAGLVTLSDWIGSNQEVFHYTPPDFSLADYLDGFARPAAFAALERAGIAPRPAARVSGFAALTATSREPSPLQAFVETVDLPSAGGALFLIEDMTGAGKTEAALILAHRLMQLGRAGGLFVALPTMATANAMYARLADCYRRLFQPGLAPSLALAHGAARLHEGFQSSILDVGRAEPRSGNADDDVSASAACAAWIADDRRKTFFADVGVGTIDQALLGVLPVKFAALRLFGLSRRVLIIDEAHAYDAYMGEELARLITFQTAQGGTTIVLSATLPEQVKDKLLRAHALGLRQTPQRTTWPSAYPLVTTVDGAGPVRTNPLATRPDLPRTVAVRRLADERAALDAIVTAARKGACAVYVRNTVDDARAAFAALAAQGIDVTLFHARFAMGDRLAIEKRVVETFGPRSTAEGRAGKVLIATQVVEQSLDLDFDLMASDLAPIDLLIQRAGRLWRHARGARALPAPDLWVVSPDPVADADGEWYRRMFFGASYVYDNHALLWKTARVLFEAGAIRSPEGVRPLVEGVYATGALDDVPEGLEGRRSIAEGKQEGDRAVAKMNLLILKKGYALDSGSWVDEAKTPTRLGDLRTTLRLARVTPAGALVLWALNGVAYQNMTPDDWQRTWALSEVSVRKYWAEARGSYDTAIERAAVEIEAGWRESGDTAVIVPLIGVQGNPGVAEGFVKGAKLSRLVYSRREGVIFELIGPS